MNPRIQELMTEAGIDVERLRMHPGGWPREDLLVLEDFAELIVEEMYDFMCKATDNDGAWPSSKKVKQHFGVEE